jgi:geranylgeranyl diphosphate synthase, type II
LSGVNTKIYSSLYDKQRILLEKKLSTSLNKRKPESLYGPGKYIISGGGKRLRPLLLIFSAKAVGSKSNFYNTASAVELLHNFTLVHDDIMDNADKRRGRKTLHKMYDINKALLVGDSLLSVAYEILLSDVKVNQAEIVNAFTKSLVEICEGQSMDKDFETAKKVTLDEYMIMIRKKTAEMLKMCCKVGALAGSGSREEINALSSYGINLGIAFQIQDDLLDITGNEGEFGKKIGGDLIEGKKTFLILKALETAKGQFKKELEKYINSNGIKQEKIHYFKSMFEENGVIRSAEEEIRKYTQKALTPLKNLKEEKYKNFFIWLANNLIHRKN